MKMKAIGDMREVVKNEKTNLLQLEEHFYQLNDVAEPNVFRNLFPYDEVPKIAFNDRIVPHNMPEEIWITDTTFRDGQQSRAPYTAEQIVKIYDYLHRLGGPNGKIRQSEFFLYSKKDRDAVYKCLERGYRFPEVTSWIRANKKDFQLVKDIGLRETGILVSCSDYHIFYKMRMTRREAMNQYLSVIRECLETGISPRCHLEDITRSDIYGFVIPFCLELMKLMDEYQIPIRIRACDTMGYGVNFAGAVIPRSVQGIIYGLTTHAGVPSELIEWHGHNDFYKAVTNSTTAWLYGASGVNCSLFGIGERTGNTPLEAMVFEYAQLRGSLDGMDTTVITELAEYFEKELGYVVFDDVLNTADYGIPQTRRRFVLVGSTLGAINIIAPTHNRNDIHVRDFIRNLPPIEAGEVDPNDALHRSARLSERNLERIRHSNPGGTWRDWPEELRCECHKKPTGQTYSSVYGRMTWDQIGPTITTQFYNYGTGRYGHPDQDRALSLREGAMLQTFPDWYDFIDPERNFVFSNIARHIGNAVPVRLGEVIGETILRHLEEHNIDV